MFERPAVPTESRAEDVANNVRELCKLDPSYAFHLGLELLFFLTLFAECSLAVQ